MTVRGWAVLAAPIVVAAAAVSLVLLYIGRIEGPGDPADLRDELTVEGFDRVATLPDATVFAGPAGTAVRLSGPGAPWVNGGTTVGLPEDLGRGLDVVVSGRAEDDCLVQAARFRRDALPADTLRSWSIAPSEVEGAAAGSRDLLYVWVTCGGG
ncbi:hypothetical protein AB0425_38545 [Actinosynnema sp. NPDC051121]